VLEKVILIGEEIPEGCLKFEDLLETKAGVEEIRSTLEQAHHGAPERGPPDPQ
jgi:hypothetical protein